MKLAAEVWQLGGGRVVALSHQGAAAADILAAEISSPGHAIVGNTIAMLELGKVDVCAGDMLLIDEPGMASRDQLDRIVALAASQDAVVRLLGDPQQLPSIEAGGTLGLLAAATDAPSLHEVRRFNNPEEGDITPAVARRRHLRRLLVHGKDPRPGHHHPRLRLRQGPPGPPGHPRHHHPRSGRHHRRSQGRCLELMDEPAWSSLQPKLDRVQRMASGDPGSPPPAHYPPNHRSRRHPRRALPAPHRQPQRRPEITTHAACSAATHESTPRRSEDTARVLAAYKAISERAVPNARDTGLSVPAPGGR